MKHKKPWNNNNYICSLLKYNWSLPSCFSGLSFLLPPFPFFFFFFLIFSWSHSCLFACFSLTQHQTWGLGLQNIFLALQIIPLIECALSHSPSQALGVDVPVNCLLALLAQQYWNRNLKAIISHKPCLSCCLEIGAPRLLSCLWLEYLSFSSEASEDWRSLESPSPGLF